VDAAQEAPAAVGGLLEASVVARGDVATAEAVGELGEHHQLHRAVAGDAGDGGASAPVLVEEGLDDVGAKGLSLVEDVMRDAEVLAAAARVVTVFRGAAAAYL